jgi:DNA-binding response OmpR family regulator
VVKLELMRILVFEDEGKLAGHLSQAPEYEGHEVRVVYDGSVAFIEARDRNYDLLMPRCRSARKA